MKRKVKLLSQHDVDEVLKFREHLADKAKAERGEMTKEAFYRKYQEYMGLSDAELNAILAGTETRR